MGEKIVFSFVWLLGEKRKERNQSRKVLWDPCFFPSLRYWRENRREFFVFPPCPRFLSLQQPFKDNNLLRGRIVNYYNKQVTIFFYIFFFVDYSLFVGAYIGIFLFNCSFYVIENFQVKLTCKERGERIKHGRIKIKKIKKE